MMSPSRLAAWLRQLPRNVDKYVIIWLPPSDDSDEKVLATYPSYAESETTHENFAETVLSEVQSHCDTAGSVCRYDIRAIQGEKEVLSSRTVRSVPRSPDELPDPLSISNNPIAANTAMQQMVRMNEAALRLHVQSFGMIQAAWKEILEVQKQQIETLLERETQLANNVLLQLANQSDVEESEIRKSNALNKLTDLLETYAPVVVANIGGAVGDSEK